MKSSSLRQMVKDGTLSPRDYRDALIHDWYLTDEYKKHLLMYMLAETTPEEFFAHTKDGELFLGDRSYSITYIHSPAILRKADYLVLSLRYCEKLQRGYVLVKVLEGNGQFKQLEY